jgi:hypothetical protein
MSLDQANSVQTIIEYDDDVMNAEQPQPLPMRDYVGEIRTAEVKKSQKETLYADAVFYISPDQYPVDYTDGNPEGTQVHVRISVERNPQARWQMRKFISAIGAKGGARLDTSEWVGLQAKLSVAPREYQGNYQNDVKLVSKL